MSDGERAAMLFTFVLASDFDFFFFFTISGYLFYQLTIYVNTYVPNYITRGHLETALHDKAGRDRLQTRCD